MDAKSAKEKYDEMVMQYGKTHLISLYREGSSGEYYIGKIKKNDRHK